MRFSSTVVLALPAIAVAEQQFPIIDKIMGYFTQAASTVSSAIPSIPTFSADTAKYKAAAKAAAAIQYPINLENWRETLTVDPTVSAPTTQDWLIFVTGGNNSCFGMCHNVTTAWNATLPLLAAKPNAPKFAYLDCEIDNILCNSWSVGAPSLYYFQIPKPLADQSAPVPTVRYQPLNRTSTTAQIFKDLILNNEIEKVAPYEGIFHPFNGLLQKYQLAVPYGYATWAFSKMPSWLPMIFISFASRSFMGKRMNPGNPAAPAGAPAAAQ